jgi:hypothetical protein
LAGYTLNGNPWGGSFILEASTNGSSWEPMVVKSSNGTRSGNILSGYNSDAFSNTTFSIYKPSATYTSPDSLSNSTIPSSLSLNSTVTNCTIDISGGNPNPPNSVHDFSVTLVPENATYPYWTISTQFNCTVKNYSSNTLTGKCKIAVVIRSGPGTGVESNQLLDSVTYYIKRSFTFTGILAENNAGNLVISLLFPTGLSSTSNLDMNPTLCSLDSGTVINSSGQSTVSCTIATGGSYYLYIKLSDNSFNNLNVSSSQITVSSNMRFKYIKDTGITIAQGGVQNAILFSAGAWYAGSQKSQLSLTIITSGPLLPSNGVDTSLIDVVLGTGDPSIHYISNTVYALGDGKTSVSCGGVSTSNDSIIVFTASSSSAGTLTVNGSSSVQTFSMWSSGSAGDGYVTVGFHPAVKSAEFRWW